MAPLKATVTREAGRMARELVRVFFTLKTATVTRDPGGVAREIARVLTTGKTAPKKSKTGEMGNCSNRFLSGQLTRSALLLSMAYIGFSFSVTHYHF